jgi:hypothetical protein
MKKKPRPSFLKQLERRYGPNREMPDDGHKTPKFKPTKEKKSKLPRVYPVSTQGAVRQPRKVAGEGVIDMTVQQFVSLAIFFVLLACAGSAIVSYGVVEVSGASGPQGVQGIQGEAGERGPQGIAGPEGPPGNEASQEMIKRLAGLWAVQQASQLQGGSFVEFNDPAVSSCVTYVLTGEPGVGACPGFTGN